MNHYETLGVPTDASPEDIKQAYRRQAANAHPDREGGSTEKMALVNRAYEVLSDAERRTRYDETGDDAGQPPIERQARDLVMQLIQKALGEDHKDLITAVRSMIKRVISSAETEQSMARRKAARLEKRRAKIKAHGQTNLVHLVIDTNLDQLRRNLKGLNDALEVGKAALPLLDGYEDETAQEPAEQAPRGGLHIDPIAEAVGSAFSRSHFTNGGRS